MSEEPEYMTLEEAAQYIGIKRPSLYHYIEPLGIEIQHFLNNRYAYLAKEDVEKIKQAREKPWKVSPKKKRKHAA